MDFSVNLYPERRRRPLQEETGTSKFFAPSTNQQDVEMQDSPEMMAKMEPLKMKDDPVKMAKGEPADKEDEPSSKKRMRQMTIDFSDGTMGTKKPLTNPIARSDEARKTLTEVAGETIRMLPGLLHTRPDIGTEGYRCSKEDIHPRFCPCLPSIRVRVLSQDTIDAALDLQSKQISPVAQKPVAILNMANANHAGGGWKHGALAQEEAICYRTSLSLTLKRSDYPIPDDAAIYSPRVMIIRDSLANGHELLDCRNPTTLKVISVVSCAAVCLPRLKKHPQTGVKTYATKKDQVLMLEKMRIILRTAIRRKHQQIVLDALGCGAFGNPNIEVAEMWKSVLLEYEFAGGWWQDVVFAVLGDSKADSNFKVFHDALDGILLS